MRAPPLWLLALSICVLASAASSCLPADTRPPPATVALFVSPNDATQTGITTIDGWTIVIDRFFVGIGDTSVGDACISYSDAGYTRLLDATRSEDQKLSLLFALGQCNMDFRVSGPASDTILGAGITEADALLQGSKGTDPYVDQPESISVGLGATATRGAETERFNWSFRQTIGYRNCGTPLDGMPVQPLDFPSNAAMSYHLVLHPEALLKDDLASDASFRFDALASADTLLGNSDGEIALEELGRVSLADVRKAGPYGIGDADPTTINSLEDYVYLVLLPTISQFREPIVCKPTVRMSFD